VKKYESLHPAFDAQKRHPRQLGAFVVGDDNDIASGGYIEGASGDGVNVGGEDNEVSAVLYIKGSESGVVVSGGNNDSIRCAV
jgi:hypothetical protein